jgi:hypothetical protein
MFAKLKKFDAHVKVLDGVHQQTLIGALLTVISFALLLTLLVSEFSIFTQVNTVSRLEVDKGVGVEAIKLIFDVSFHKVSCDRISFNQEATRGTMHSHEPVQVNKVDVPSGGPLNKLGCRVFGWMIIDKIGGNFRFGVTESPDAPVENLSHTVHLVTFLPTNDKIAVDKVPGATSNISELTVVVPENTGIYQYALQVIPTQYKELYGELFHMNQYSFSEKAINIEQAKRGDPFYPLPVRDFTGVLFTYDFHPVRLSFRIPLITGHIGHHA